nr:hypothetical protein BgiMline_002708 [Biomphalaria glabrata]
MESKNRPELVPNGIKNQSVWNFLKFKSGKSYHNADKTSNEKEATDQPLSSLIKEDNNNTSSTDPKQK